MERTYGSARRVCLGVALAALLTAATGPAEARPRVYAITGGTVIPTAGQKIEDGTVVLRDGIVEAVGAKISVPPDAVVIDARGLWIYPGLIDAGGWSPAAEATPAAAAERGRAAPREAESGPVYPLPSMRPERRASASLTTFEGDRKRDADAWRRLGFTALLAAPTKGILRGSGALVLLADDVPVTELVVKDGIGSFLAFETAPFGSTYPTSVMGAAAALRQILLDARREVVWNARYEKNPLGMPRPGRMPAFEALRPVLDGRQSLVLEATSADDVLLADRIAKEFRLGLVAIASGSEAEIADQIATTGRTLIYPARIPDKPKVDSADDALDVSLRELERYTGASLAPKRLRDAGVPIVLSAHGLKNTADFPANVRKIIDAGFPEDAALAALTTGPAKLLGLDATLGSLEPGKIANVVLADGPLFSKDTKVKRVFVDGADYPIDEKQKPKGDPNAVVDPRGTWSVVLETGGSSVARTWTIAGSKGAYTGTAETRAGTVTFEKVELAGNALTLTFPAAEGRGAREVTVIVSGDAFEGTMEMGPRSVPVKGTRTQGPGGGAS